MFQTQLLSALHVLTQLILTVSLEGKALFFIPILKILKQKHKSGQITRS